MKFDMVCKDCGESLEAHDIVCPNTKGLSLGWIAGFIDGEGTFSIRTKRNKQYSFGIEFVPTISIYQKNPVILKEIASTLNVVKPQKLQHRVTGSKGAYGEAFRLSIEAQDNVLRITKMLKPQIRLKQKQADNVIEAAEILLHKGITHETFKRLVVLVRETRALNGLPPDDARTVKLEPYLKNVV